MLFSAAVVTAVFYRHFLPSTGNDHTQQRTCRLRIGKVEYSTVLRFIFRYSSSYSEWHADNVLIAAAQTIPVLRVYKKKCKTGHPPLIPFRIAQSVPFWGQLLRGSIVNRTYGEHKNLYISLFLLAIFGPVYYGPPYYL